MVYSNLRKIIVGILIYVIFVCNNVSIAEESTKDRIEKHRAWLNQRTKDRELVGYVETNDPIQKIKYFKKLIKFKNKSDHSSVISFVPHENNVNELTTVAIDTGNKFAYDTINNNEVSKYELETTSDILPSSLERNINNIIAGVDKQNSDMSSTTIRNNSLNEIEKEKKINDTDDVSMRNVIETTSMSSTSIDSKKTDTSSDVEIQRFISEHIKYQSSDVTIKKSWGKWSHWSSCSRTCGEGVSSQSRECILKHYKHGKRINVTTIALNECIGFFRRFRVCNEKECPENSDFRREQCSSYDDKVFRGIQYTWVPYIKEDAECELNCKPINQKYFAKLKDFVTDGTPCTLRKIENNSSISIDKAVCVEGKCKAVLKNGMISGSGFINSGNIRCGASICRPISGMFLKNPLPNGYVHVTTIPAAASNITITELRDSINLLALKSTDSEFIINGNYTAAPSGTTKYNVGGTEFKYHRIDGGRSSKEAVSKKSDEITEWITSAGPLYKPIHIMVLSQQSNPGIKYEYLLPINFASSEETGSETELDYSVEENSPHTGRLKAANYQANSTAAVSRKKKKFVWKIIGYTACSRTCGGGTQSPIIRCVRGDGTKAYSPKRCLHLQKPIVSENLMKCNSQPCPAFWKLSDWSNCHCGESNEKTEKTREVKCVQELISGVVIQVNSGACNQDRPVNNFPCDCVKPVKTNNGQESLKPFRIPSKLQSNTQNDQKISIAGKNKIKPQRSKKIGVWLTSDWSESCSNECGIGQQFRTIFCDRSMSSNDRTHIERCDLRLTPNTYRECSSEAKCHGDWFIGPWSLCQGDCFNASRSRTVVCIKNDGFAEESECDLKAKPATFEDCTPDEMKDCRPKWHFSEWTECSKSCNSGIQKRTVKCLEIDKKDRVLRESKNCKYSERPNAMKYCNTQDCSETTTSYDPRVDLLQNDDPNCVDEFPNCEIVLHSKLCGYHYYNENCCKSCRSFSNELYL